MRLLISLACALFVLSGPCQAKSLKDMAGREVETPDRIERIACLEVLCYPTLFMLGAADRVRVMVDTSAPWMLETNPRVGSIAKLIGDADVEDLLMQKIDLAFFFYNAPRMLAQLSSVGIPSLITQPTGRPPESADVYAQDAKSMVRLYGRALGGEAERRAEDWCAYFDEKVSYVAARVTKIPSANKRRLYYVRGPRALNTQGRGGYVYWLGQMSGAHMVVGDAPLGAGGPVSMEDVLRWDPQVIIVGRQYGLDLVLDDPRWRHVAAVREGEVFPSPAGVFYWDGGPESILMMLFLAKTLYPALFHDLDLTEEIKGYYARFYRFALSDDQAQKILRGQWPDGRRFNPVNN